MNHNKINIKELFKEAMFILTSVIPLSLSMSFFLGLGSVVCIIITCIACIFSAKAKDNKIMPVYLTFTVLLYCISVSGIGTAAFSAMLCGLLLLILNPIAKKLNFSFNPAVTGTMLSGALTVTVLITTHYFGIGAQGDTVREMLSSYLSLGFHPNWRGILYGTIVMVIMITFPRKFKKLDKVISAPFIAIITTLILNLFLNPADLISAIQEIGLSFYESRIYADLPFILNGEIDFISGILCGASLYFICQYALISNGERQNGVISSSGNIFLGGCLGVILPYGIKKEKASIISGIIASVISTAILILFKAFIARIPVSSLAVIIIVGAWGSVRWGNIKKAFSSLASVVFFVISVLSILIFGVIYGLIISAMLSLISSKVLKINE